MSFLTSLVAAGRALFALELALVIVVGFLGTRLLSPTHLVRLRNPLRLTVVFVSLIPLAAYLRHTGSKALNEVELVALSIATLIAVWILGTLVMGTLEVRLRRGVPRIVSDLLIAGASVVSVSLVAARHGVNLSSLLTTSAVLTAVIGLALQDTLGNMVAGITLQLDSSIRMGDWIRVGGVSGRVSEIHWRYTAIETRDWETVIIPNSQLIKGQVSVLGRRCIESPRWRRWVHFNADFRFSPTQIQSTIESALRAEPIANVAATPEPNCVLLEICDSYYRFAVRYWLLDFAMDDPTDSVVRGRVIAALKRIGVPLSIPAKAVFLTSETDERRERKHAQDLEERIACLRRITLFDNLSDQEVKQLGAALSPVPFANGEVLTRQGAQAHWLYVILSGTVSVRVHHEDVEREVARLGPGQYFGEMGLLTGEVRTATVIALDDVRCYRLGKDVFSELLQARPTIAEALAQDLAQRRMGLLATRDDIDSESRHAHENQTASDLLRRMRAFFRLEKP